MATKNQTGLVKVFNPAKSLSGGKPVKKNPVKKTLAKVANPSKKVVKATSHRRKTRRNNPASFFGMLTAALMVGFGITLFDVLTTRFLPQTSLVWRVGIKAVGALFFQSNIASKIPVLRSYNKEIALVLAASTIVDLLKAFAVPAVDNATGGLLTGGQKAINMVKMPVDENGELSGDYYYVMEESADDYEDGEDDDEEYYD